MLFEAGKEISINENYHNCIELFKVINNYLIDGMPCDKGIKIMSQKRKIKLFMNIMKWFINI